MYYHDVSEKITYFCLVVIEKGVHLIPSRTQKLSPSSPMVLHARVWESRSLPSFSFTPVKYSSSHFTGFFLAKLLVRALSCRDLFMPTLIANSAQALLVRLHPHAYEILRIVLMHILDDG